MADVIKHGRITREDDKPAKKAPPKAKTAPKADEKEKEESK